MTFGDLPASAAWRHRGLRQGFESVFVRRHGAGYRFDGHTAAVEAGDVWVVRYQIIVDERWATRSVTVAGWSADGEREARLEADGSGRWEVGGVPAPELDGCRDVDLESSACTNTMPIHRLDLRVGRSTPAPAAYVRALDLRVERLEQEYARLDDDGVRHRYRYRAPDLDFEALLVYDASGLVLDYPGIATRAD